MDEQPELEIEELDDPDFTEDDTNEAPPSDIVAFNELRSCADLYRMFDKGILDIQPEFQRDFVWPAGAQTRFIDSLIKQLPIPSMCFALDYKRDRWIVIDGLQRMSTITRFLQGSDWRLSKLDDTDPRLGGKSAAHFKNAEGADKALFSRVENQSLPINVLRCDFSKKAHKEYLFTIFHRLNSGGSKLNNQEIRNCIYGGPLNDLLKDLDTYPAWRKLNRMEPDKNYRFVKQEMILRYFAFKNDLGKYKGQVAKFLNDYMHENQSPPQERLNEMEKDFKRTIDAVVKNIFPNGPEGRIPTSVLEAMLVAVADNIEHVEAQEPAKVKANYDALRADDNFRDEAVAEGLSKIEKVTNRFAAARQIFSS
ncbi:DUF262 domain-containing protein [Qipengyuania flava]|uniref:DUF262 domain-containing protein n=1 Tax=Qipengyuania flava TaxID=192812 RepID=UPI00141A79CE|nr:DUF262 domain-containing protein [Qipengyuania flava]NIJ61136.1 hypothetical protein [Qipengyuania flava]